MSNFTAAYERLKRLYKQVHRKGWQDKIDRLTSLPETSNLVEIRSIVKGLCEEIAHQVTIMDNENAKSLLSEFFDRIQDGSPKIQQRLAEIKKLNDKKAQEQALLQLLLSEEVQHFLTEEIKKQLDSKDQYANAYRERNQKNKKLEQILEERMQRCMNDISVMENQLSYDEVGRLMKRILDILTLLFDVLLVNLGHEPHFSAPNPDAPGKKAQNIMPMPMKM